MVGCVKKKKKTPNTPSPPPPPPQLHKKEGGQNHSNPATPFVLPHLCRCENSIPVRMLNLPKTGYGLS